MCVCWGGGGGTGLMYTHLIGIPALQVTYLRISVYAHCVLHMNVWRNWVFIACFFVFG